MKFNIKDKSYTPEYKSNYIQDNSLSLEKIQKIESLVEKEILEKGRLLKQVKNSLV